jgi:hypothetical protein
MVRTERRAERRLRYSWPVWFAEDFGRVLFQGQMIDLCSKGASFNSYTDQCPYQGQQITARFSVPRYESEEGFEMASFIRAGRVCRVKQSSPFVRRVAIRFAQELPFKPGEQDGSLCRAEQPAEVAVE